MVGSNEYSDTPHVKSSDVIDILQIFPFAGLDGQDHVRVGKMNMVDLAGSERQSKTGATGDTLKAGRFSGRSKV